MPVHDSEKPFFKKRQKFLEDKAYQTYLDALIRIRDFEKWNNNSRWFCTRTCKTCDVSFKFDISVNIEPILCALCAMRQQAEDQYIQFFTSISTVTLHQYHMINDIISIILDYTKDLEL